MTLTNGILTIGAAAALALAVLTAAAKDARAAGETGETLPPDIVIKGGTPYRLQTIGAPGKPSYGIAQAYGPSGGVDLPAEMSAYLARPKAIYAYLEGLTFEDPKLGIIPSTVDIYFIKGWDYKSDAELSFENYVGSIGAQMDHSHGITIPMEIVDFQVPDPQGGDIAEGRARSFLQSQATATSKKITLVMIVRSGFVPLKAGGQIGALSFTQLRISARPPEVVLPELQSKAGTGAKLMSSVYLPESAAAYFTVACNGQPLATDPSAVPGLPGVVQVRCDGTLQVSPISTPAAAAGDGADGASREAGADEHASADEHAHHH